MILIWVEAPFAGWWNLLTLTTKWLSARNIVALATSKSGTAGCADCTNSTVLLQNTTPTERSICLAVQRTHHWYKRTTIDVPLAVNVSYRGRAHHNQGGRQDCKSKCTFCMYVMFRMLRW